MNKKQMRTLRLLAGILAVLVIALVAVLAVKSRRAAQEDTGAAAEEQAGVITPQHAWSAISYHNGNSTLSFQVNEAGNWIWADDPEFPLDDATITAIADLLANLKPQQTITEGDTLEAYGLDQPTATLTATAADDSGTLTLSLGKTTTDGNSYYMLMNGEERPVYIIADTLYSYLSKAIYDMCALPVPPALTASNLDTVLIKGAVTTMLQATRSQENAVTWTSGGADVTGQTDAAAVLEEVGALTLTKCVDYKPSDEAVSICGLAEPIATVTASYYTESGAEQRLTLSIGSKSLDGAGYYVRLNDDTTIYQTDADSIQTLVSVAANGLGV